MSDKRPDGQTDRGTDGRGLINTMDEDRNTSRSCGGGGAGAATAAVAAGLMAQHREKRGLFLPR